MPFLLYVLSTFVIILSDNNSIPRGYSYSLFYINKKGERLGIRIESDHIIEALRIVTKECGRMPFRNFCTRISTFLNRSLFFLQIFPSYLTNKWKSFKEIKIDRIFVLFLAFNTNNYLLRGNPVFVNLLFALDIDYDLQVVRPSMQIEVKKKQKTSSLLKETKNTVLPLPEAKKLVLLLAETDKKT